MPTGDPEWAPKAFEYKAGESVRYIDFESGDDARDGLSKQTPWKHHPWDSEAVGQAKACKGVHTYVFKQGVVYRGQMDANESGAPAAPILLTRDPSWGTGPAVLCGSEAVTGWKQGAGNPLIPEPQKVWYVDLDWAPRNVWMTGPDGAVTRIALARTPNWKITDLDDIRSEWWTWKNPDKPFDNYATINGQRRHLAFDQEHINTSRPQDYREGAIVWTTKGWVMGSPFPARVLAVDREKGSLTFPGQWGGGPSYKIIRGCRYYLEDKPHYLDSPGEFWFDKKGNGGRLYLRLPGDRDPDTVRVEVARRIRMIDSRGMSHVHVRGLTFRFTNIYWSLTAAPYWVSHESIDVEPGCVRLLGSGTDIHVTHCTFEHVHRGVRMKAMGPQDAIDRVAVEDNVCSDALESHRPLAAEVGVMAGQSPLRDAAAHDFRPSADSAARGLGVKVFVPWSLYETVAEWNFYPIPGDATRILDEHWCMSPYYTGRDNYYRLPTYPLTGINIHLKDYQNGPLENWTTGVLQFNGSDQYVVLAHEDIDRPVTLTAGRGNASQSRTVGGADLSNPQIHTSNFLIEIYFKTVSGQTDATLVRKIDDAGWALEINDAGGVTLMTKSGGATVGVAGGGAVNDGRWHHVVAEADREAGTFTLYIDGRQDISGPGLRADASLANDADLYVGGTPDGHNFRGAIDFLRIARGTLADSKTTIDELYAWQFHGPFLYDFTGRPRPVDGGCAGAIGEEAQ